VASYRKGTEVEITQYKAILRELQKITDDKGLIAQNMAVAMRFAIKPTYETFKRYVSGIPQKTGNLRRAVESNAGIKVKAYKQSGNAVGLVGYFKDKKNPKKKPDKKGRDMAYHQHLIEYGTKNRKTRSGANRGISQPGGTPGIEPLQIAYRNTIGQVNSRLVQKTPSVIKSVYKKLEKFKAK
jgi:hypothetical protein